MELAIAGRSYNRDNRAVTVQEEGYQAALECNEMMLLQTQLKVEPCISAPAKPKKKGLSGTANGSQHNQSAPKACCTTSWT